MLATTLEYHAVINVPLLVFSVPFRQLLPVAIASVILSLGVCVVAGWQAELLRSKRRFWSRPLIAVLFFLQPIARGWARYQGRLSLRPTPEAAFQSLNSAALKDKATLNEVEYWAETWVDRLELVKNILKELDEQGWQNKMDAGWSDYDVDIFGSRWARLQLTTVGEPYAGGKQLLRCRLDTAWSLLPSWPFAPCWGLTCWSSALFKIVSLDLAPAAHNAPFHLVCGAGKTRSPKAHLRTGR